MACGRCRRAFSRTAKRSKPAHCAKRSRKRDARVELGDLYTVISLPQINQVYMMFRSRLLDLDFGPGTESLEVRLFDEERDSVGRARVSDDRAHVAQFLSRSQARRVQAARQFDRAAGAVASRSARSGLIPPLRCDRPETPISGTIPVIVEQNIEGGTMARSVRYLASIAALALAAISFAPAALAQASTQNLDHDRRHRRRLLPARRRDGERAVEIRSRACRRRQRSPAVRSITSSCSAPANRRSALRWSTP